MRLDRRLYQDVMVAAEMGCWDVIATLEFDKLEELAEKFPSLAKRLAKPE